MLDQAIPLNGGGTIEPWYITAAPFIILLGMLSILVLGALVVRERREGEAENTMIVALGVSVLVTAAVGIIWISTSFA